MGYSNNTSITVDAVLTKKGRELLARGRDEFNITKFALADDEIDYSLWDTAHPNGSNYYGAVIENMPLLESFVDENQIMRYKLTTLPKETAKLPILEIPSPSIVLNGAGIVQTITPTTRNGGDADTGYTFILHNAEIANLTPVVQASTASVTRTSPTIRKGKRRRVKRNLDLLKNLPGGIPNDIVQEIETSLIDQEVRDLADLAVNTGATTPVFLNETERKRSITITGKSVNIVSRSITTDTNTNLTIVGTQSGATQNIPITVKADPSKV